MLTVHVVVALGAKAASAQAVDWNQRFVGIPSNRSNHALTYDPRRAVTVLFGGYTGSGLNGETWEWNGAAWTQRIVVGPSPRYLHAMAFDSLRGVTVLFGGQNSFTSSNAETWEWNGSTWSLRNTVGPARRSGHALSFDPARGVTVLFGGLSNGTTIDGETWEWNGSAWIQRAVAGPSARFQHAMAYDFARHVTVLFGGKDSSLNLRGELWEWDGIAWVYRNVSGPSPRCLHAMSHDVARGVTVLFGGQLLAGPSDETWEWNGSAWSQQLVNGPSARHGLAMAFDAARFRTALFGGLKQPNVLDAETWELSPACAPGLVRDCNGNCAPASWIGDGICDSGFYRYNGVPIYFNCAQFGNDGGDCNASSPPITNPPNHGVPASPPQYEPIMPPTGPNKLILVTHGWNTTAERFADYWVPLKDAISAAVGPEWKVRAYNWTADSQTGIFSWVPELPPNLAYNNALWHGMRLGRELGQRNPPYEHVHLIAHSAGSALIAAAASRIKHFSSSTTVHTTYLDAFEGNAEIPGVGPPAQAYGANADWSDHYWTPLWDPFTDLRLPNSFNLNVAPVDPYYPNQPIGAHTWPCCFYRFTVDANTAGGCNPPAGSTLDWGFPLSYEQWTQPGSVQAWKAARLLDYPRGDVRTLHREEVPPAMVFRTRRDPPIDLLAIPSFPSSLEAIQITPAGLIMTTQPPSAPASAAAWVNFEITTTTFVNFITFNMSITGEPSAEGLLTMYVNGAKCGLVDQPYTLPGSQPYSMPTPGDLAPGQHFVSFRLDPINATLTNLTIQYVATGMGKYTPACYGNCDQSTVAPVLTANDFQCFLNKFAAQDPYANCDQSTGIPSLTANDFQCFLNSFTAGCS